MRFSWENAGLLRPLCLARNGPGRLSGGAAGRIGGIYRQSSQGLRVPELDGLSDLRPVRHGRLGLADGTINCIEQAYDLESERFRVSLLKHEAQHTVDRKRFPQITPAELEYRAKLVELHFSGDPGLLQKFLSEADESKPDDSHAVASARIGREFADTDQTVLSCIQTRALELLRAHTRELEEKYGESRDHPNGEAV